MEGDFMPIDDATRNALRNILSDPNFKQSLYSPFLYYGPIGSAKVGVVLATKKPPYDKYALNQGDLELVIKAKTIGKIDEAYVVHVEWKEDLPPGSKPPGTDPAYAVAIHTKWKDLPPRSGPFGPFWTASIFTDEEEPFGAM
jgi:hypothetical protein